MYGSVLPGDAVAAPGPLCGRADAAGTTASAKVAVASSVPRTLTRRTDLPEDGWFRTLASLLGNCVLKRRRGQGPAAACFPHPTQRQMLSRDLSLRSSGSQ